MQEESNKTICVEVGGEKFEIPNNTLESTRIYLVQLSCSKRVRLAIDRERGFSRTYEEIPDADKLAYPANFVLLVFRKMFSQKESEEDK